MPRRAPSSASRWACGPPRARAVAVVFWGTHNTAGLTKTRVSGGACQFVGRHAQLRAAVFLLVLAKSDDFTFLHVKSEKALQPNIFHSDVLYCYEHWKFHFFYTFQLYLFLKAEQVNSACGRATWTASSMRALRRPAD